MENPQLNYWRGENPTISLWTTHFPLSLNLSPLLLAVQGIQGPLPFVYSSLNNLDTSGRALQAKGMPWHAIGVLQSVLQCTPAL